MHISLYTCCIFIYIYFILIYILYCIFIYIYFYLISCLTLYLIRTITSVFTKEELEVELQPVVEQLIKMDEAVWFREPVDPEKENIPDYFDVIKTPMDLGTIRKKLQSGSYSNPWNVSFVQVSFLYNVFEYWEYIEFSFTVSFSCVDISSPLKPQKQI